MKNADGVVIKVLYRARKKSGYEIRGVYPGLHESLSAL